MAEEVIDYSMQYFGEMNTRLRDLEEKQRILKDRLLLVGQNLIETKEDTNDKLIELKKDVEILKQSLEKIMSFVEAVTAELHKFAKKDDVDILVKQAKMFQP